MKIKYISVKIILITLLISGTLVESTAQSPLSYSYTQVENDFRALLERPKAAFNPVFKVQITDSVIIEKGVITTDINEKVPVVIYKPVSKGIASFPVVICHHGTGGTKEQADIKAFMMRFTKLGFMAVAIDARYHGERIPGGAHAKKEYEQAVIAAWENKDKSKQQYPFLYDTVYDCWRLVDYLVSRPDVQASRIGMMGISMGGIETWMAAAVDKRIKVAVPIIAAQSFKWSLENDRWQGRANTILAAHEEVAKEMGDPGLNKTNVKALWAKVVPGITDEFDCPSMVRLIAPRPLLLLSTEKDNNCPLPGAEIAYQAAVKAYSSANAADKLGRDVAAGQSHRLTPGHMELAISWFKKWL